MQRVVGDMLNEITTSLGASFNGSAMRVLDCYGYSISLKWTGASAAGAIKLQAAVSNINVPATWHDIADATYTVSGAGQVLFLIGNVYYTHVRIVFTQTSGTGTLTEAIFSGKGA